MVRPGEERRGSDQERRGEEGGGGRPDHDGKSSKKGWPLSSKGGGLGPSCSDHLGKLEKKVHLCVNSVAISIGGEGAVFSIRPLLYIIFTLMSTFLVSSLFYFVFISFPVWIFCPINYLLCYCYHSQPILHWSIWVHMLLRFGTFMELNFSFFWQSIFKRKKYR